MVNGSVPHAAISSGPLIARRIAPFGDRSRRQIVDKRGVFARQIGRLDVVGEEFERVGGADVVLVAAPGVGLICLTANFRVRTSQSLTGPNLFTQSLNR